MCHNQNLFARVRSRHNSTKIWPVKFFTVLRTYTELKLISVVLFFFFGGGGEGGMGSKRMTVNINVVIVIVIVGKQSASYAQKIYITLERMRNL